MSLEKVNGLVEILESLINTMKNDEYLNKDLKSIKLLENTENKLKNRKYTVSVIAAMKAGKSTTFNALIGRDLLPNERAACTTSITEIKHSNVEGDAILKYYTDGKVEKITATSEKTLEEMFHEDVRNSRKLDGVSKIDKYYVETPIKALEGTEYEDLIQNFVLVDTPGPNEANIGDFDTKILQQLALEQLRNSDALIMLLDYESYKSEVNATILKDIFNNRKDLKDDTSKVYFLLNKIDSMGSKDGTLEEVISDVKKLITNYTGIKEPKVFGLSGKQAMLSRCVNNNTANDNMKKEIKSSYGSKYSEIRIIDGEEYTLVPSVEKFSDKLLKDSKIEIIENEIISDVFKRASSDMITNSTNKIYEVIDYTIGNADSEIKILSKDSEKIKTVINISIKNLNELKNKSGVLKKLPKEEFNKVKDEVYSILNGLEENIEIIVAQQFPEDNIIESNDRDALNERIDFIRMNTLGLAQSYVNGEVDKVQRICINAQARLNNSINIEFNKLIREATKEAKDEINLTPRTFDINDAIESYNSSDYAIDTEYEDDGLIESKEFTALGATVGATGGAAIGAVVGSVVPIVGTAIGAVIGGIIGLFCGSKKTTVQETKREVFKADISDMKENILKSTKEAVIKSREQVELNIDKFVSGYTKLITRELNKYISEIEKEYIKKIEEQDKENTSKEIQISHMTDIKMKMAGYLDYLEKIK